MDRDMEKTNEILTIAGKKVMVRYTRDGQPCEKCVFGEKDSLCQRVRDECSRLDKVGMEIDERAYFVDAERQDEKDYKRLYEELVNSEWYKKYYQGASVGGSVVVEQPEADLEVEIERWWNERYAKLKKDYKFDSTSGHYLDNETIIDLARHFVEWGAEHLKK